MDPVAALLAGRRRAAVLTAAGALAVLVGLGAAVAGGSRPTGFDRVVGDWLAGWLSPGQAQAFADLGSFGAIVVAAGLLALAFAARRWFRGAALVVSAPPVAVALVEAAKPVFGRTSGAGLAYPSGHTAAVSAVVLALVVTAAGPGRWVLAPWRIVVAAGASGAVAFLCAAGLVVAGYHYATDTVGGFALASATVSLLALAIDAVADRSAARRAVPSADLGAGVARTSVR